MITPPTKSFFVIHISGEAADYITNKFSPEVTSDIREAVLISDDYETDIEAHNSMDSAVDGVKKQLRKGRIKMEMETKHNPLYIPSTPEQLENVLEDLGDNFKFTGFDGNPFTMKSVAITSNDKQLVNARVSCHQFDLPTYSEIISGQENKVLN